MKRNNSQGRKNVSRGKNKNSLQQQKEQRTQMKPPVKGKTMSLEKKVQQNGRGTREIIWG